MLGEPSFCINIFIGIFDIFITVRYWELGLAMLARTRTWLSEVAECCWLCWTILFFIGSWCPPLPSPRRAASVRPQKFFCQLSWGLYSLQPSHSSWPPVAGLQESATSPGKAKFYCMWQKWWNITQKRPHINSAKYCNCVTMYIYSIQYTLPPSAPLWQNLRQIENFRTWLFRGKLTWRSFLVSINIFKTCDACFLW